MTTHGEMAAFPINFQPASAGFVVYAVGLPPRGGRENGIVLAEPAYPRRAIIDDALILYHLHPEHSQGWSIIGGDAPIANTLIQGCKHGNDEDHN